MRGQEGWRGRGTCIHEALYGQSSKNSMLPKRGIATMPRVRYGREDSFIALSTSLHTLALFNYLPTRARADDSASAASLCSHARAASRRGIDLDRRLTSSAGVSTVMKVFLTTV